MLVLRAAGAVHHPEPDRTAPAICGSRGRERESTTMKKWWSIVFMLCLMAYGIACSLDVREAMIRLRGDYLGASGFPRIVGVLLAVVCLVAIVGIIRGGEEATEGTPLTKKSFLLIGITSGYILGISYLGFTISTLVYLFCTTMIFSDFNRSRIRGIVIYSVVVTAVAFLFFKGFKVYLPDTLLF